MGKLSANERIVINITAVNAYTQSDISSFYICLPRFYSVKNNIKIQDFLQLFHRVKFQSPVFITLHSLQLVMRAAFIKAISKEKKKKPQKTKNLPK